MHLRLHTHQHSCLRAQSTALHPNSSNGCLMWLLQYGTSELPRCTELIAWSCRHILIHVGCMEMSPKPSAAFHRSHRGQRPIVLFSLDFWTSKILIHYYELSIRNRPLRVTPPLTWYPSCHIPGRYLQYPRSSMAASAVPTPGSYGVCCTAERYVTKTRKSCRWKWKVLSPIFDRLGRILWCRCAHYTSITDECNVEPSSYEETS